jgi:hypothetical protein
MKILAAFLILFLSASLVLADPPFDWNRAKEIHARAQRGEVLSDDDRKYLDEAVRRHNAGEPIGGAPAKPAGPTPVPVLQWSGHLTPLTELKDPYHGQDGGLYGGGKNEPPPAQTTLANQAIAQIQPLDTEGHPSPSGKIALLSIGMSNTTMEFSAFVKDADADPRKAANVIVVDGAQGGKDAPAWSKSDAPPWDVANQRLTAAGLTPQQVQAIWIKQAIGHPKAGFPTEAERLRDYLRDIVTLAKQKYPNLRVAYLSSRIYGGYAVTPLNPEPYAYEGAFAVRWLIDQQIKGDPALNAAPDKGQVKAPVLLWGPYLWADGQTPRESDHLFYTKDDLGNDGTHPAQAARVKVAHLFTEFFATNPLAKPWYAKK